jgi:hypothetical protein
MRRSNVGASKDSVGVWGECMAKQGKKTQAIVASTPNSIRDRGKCFVQCDNLGLQSKNTANGPWFGR